MSHHRREQRESVVLRATQEVISRGDLADPRIRGLITVTGVRMTEDGKHAFVSVSVLPEERAELTMHGLRAATPHIRRDVMKKIRIREMPVMEFRLDESIKRQAEVLGAINRAADEPRPSGASEPPEPAAGSPPDAGVEPGAGTANDPETNGGEAARNPDGGA